MTKFYGPLEIESESVDPSTGDITITLIQEKDSNVQHNPVRLPKVMYDRVVTDTISDWSSLRDRRVGGVVADVLGIFLKWNVLIDEAEFIFNLTTQSINMTQEAAETMLWGSRTLERSMADLERVVRQIPNKVEEKPSETGNTSNHS